jgi:murein endopeptidase
MARRGGGAAELRGRTRSLKDVRYRAVVVVLVAAATGCQGATTWAGRGIASHAATSRDTDDAEPRVERRRIHWRNSTAVGQPWAGRLINGVRLPAEGRLFFTWDPVKQRSPNRTYRRHGTDRLVRVTLNVLRAYAEAHPNAPRVGVGDLSRPRGGNFGEQFGGLGHSSHQNGLDVDVYYPRRDGRERAPRRPSQIDRALAQDLVDRFARAGARFVFVGPRTGLRGPPRVVQPLIHHDDHMHVRIRRRAP